MKFSSHLSRYAVRLLLLLGGTGGLISSTSIAIAAPEADGPHVTRVAESLEVRQPATAIVMPRVVIQSMMLWAIPGSQRFDIGSTLEDSAVFGGFYENAPLVPVIGKRYKSGSFLQVFKDIETAGVDVINLDCFERTTLDQVHWWLEEARLSGTGIMISPMIDRMPRRGTRFLAELWERKDMISHPNLFKVDGKPFITIYGHREPAFIKEVLQNVKEAGADYVIIGDLSSLGSDVWGKGIIPERALESISMLDGAWFFGGNLSLFNSERSIVQSLKTWALAQTPRKIFGGSVRGGYISSRRVGHLVSPDGTDKFRRIWIDIIKENPDFAYLSTLNDYSESEMDCSGNASFSFIDMNKYFGSRWKTGQWPHLDKPQAFLTYRKALAVGEPVTVELVLLRPDINGRESVEEIGKLFRIESRIILNNEKAVTLDPGKIEVLPGHLVWKMRAPGFVSEGLGTPEVRIWEKDGELAFPSGRAASFSIVDNGEAVARKWLNVPLHRIYPDKEARLEVVGSPGNLYPRTLSVGGLPTKDVVGGQIELSGNPLRSFLPPDQLASGYIEEFYSGPGYGPMLYKDGFVKRTYMDKVDRYTAIVRMSGDRFLYPKPMEVPSPRVDPSTVTDLIISAGKSELIDRGPLRRNFTLPSESPRNPKIVQDKASKLWILRFDGTQNCLRFGQAYSPDAVDPMTMPPGPATLEMWVRPRKNDRLQVLFESGNPVLDIVLLPKGFIRLTRVNEASQNVSVTGKSAPGLNQWHHIVAVFTGSAIRLFIDGKEDAAPAPCVGLKTEAGSMLGASMNASPQNFFYGDVARFRILQRSLNEGEVVDEYMRHKNQFSL
ncbi:MAG: hypothetical protein LBK99_06740 [Opitutaceae bacterium]|jgi:hypothetical protein|nr:hypothetical protein [Opitutaceae bacterium]